MINALGKKRTVAPNSRFAVFNILEALLRCAEEGGMLIEIMTTGELFDPSHTGIFGYPHANGEIAAILAELVTHQIYTSTGTAA